MSHDRGWRAVCFATTWIRWIHFAIPSVARGVTAMVVGSGAWFGLFLIQLVGSNSIADFAALRQL